VLFSGGTSRIEACDQIFGMASRPLKQKEERQRDWLTTYFGMWRWTGGQRKARRTVD